MILLISYDLKEPNRDYESLYEAIKNAGTSWWHYLESTWIINTNLPIDECSNLLHGAMDANDTLLIVDITGKAHQGWLPSKAWDWFSTNK